MSTRLSNWPDKSLRVHSRHSRKGLTGSSFGGGAGNDSRRLAGPPRSPKFQGFFHFLWAGVFQQTRTGSIIPSQRFLVEKMIAPVPRDYRGQIVELGCGTGALTLRLAERCREARILACEINPTFAQISRDNLAVGGLAERVEIVGKPAERLLTELTSSGNKRPDFVISGIPLAHLRHDDTIALVGAISRALAEGGLYIQFQYSLLDRKNIRRFFPNLLTRPVLLNFPPAVVYYARR